MLTKKRTTWEQLPKSKDPKLEACLEYLWNKTEARVAKAKRINRKEQQAVKKVAGNRSLYYPHNYHYHM
jgi:hypothetical protein